MCSLWAGFFARQGHARWPPKKAMALEESAVSSMFETVRFLMGTLFQIELLRHEV